MGRIAIVVALTIGVSTAARGDRLADIRARGRLIVSVKNDAKHVHKDPAHSQKRGFEIALARTLAQKIVGDADKLELRLLARPLRLPMLASGAVDLVVSMIPVTAENTATVDFSHPYFASGLALLMRAGAPPLSLGELAGKTVAFRTQSFNDSGGELERLARAHGLTVTVRYFPSTKAAAEAVTRGEVAALGGNLVDLEAFAHTHPGFTVDTHVLEPQTVAVAVKKGEPTLLAAVNQVIDELRTSGRLAAEAAHWHLPYLLR